SARSVVKLDPSLQPQDIAALADAGLTAIHAVKKAIPVLSPGTRAVVIGAGIETDLQLTKDGVPVIIHDADLYRVTGLRKFVTELTFDEVRALKVGRNRWKRLFGQPVMTFGEFLQWARAAGCPPLNIELKETFLDHPEAVEQTVMAAKGYPDLHFSSFHYPLLMRVKQTDPGMETALILTKKSRWDNLGVYGSSDGFHIHKRLWSGKYLGAIERESKFARVYGVDGTEPFIPKPEPLIRGWITDFPDTVKKAMQKGS
ncbi:MAG: glycerophosphodiester phosphodiesterase family protein, partial [Bhargavaea sp.]